MSSYETSTYLPDNLIAGGYPLVTEKVTLLSGENVVRGEVLGKVTASGKFKASLSGGGDGSETPDALAAETVDASTGDKPILVYLSGEFTQSALTIGADHTVASIKDELRSKNIYLKATSPNVASV